MASPSSDLLAFFSQMKAEDGIIVEGRLTAFSAALLRPMEQQLPALSITGRVAC